MKNILLVMGGIDAGGAEKWALDFSNKIDKKNYKIFIFCHEDKDYFFESEFVKTGAIIIKQNISKNPILYINKLNEAIVEHDIDLVHSHVNHFSSLICISKFIHGKPVVVHCHNDLSVYKEQASFLKKIYYGLSEIIIDKLSDSKIAVSDLAGGSLFIGRYELIYCGIDSDKLLKNSTRVVNNIDFDSKFLGKKNIFHIGRFVEQKNHQFILNLAEYSLKKDENIQYVLIGDGPKFENIQKEILERNLHNIILFGLTDQVGYLLYNYSDLNILPSNHEGLPITLMETQALGIKSIVSDRVTEESVLSDSLVEFLSIDNQLSIENWFEKINDNNRIDKNPLCGFLGSKFDINECVKKIEIVYENV